MEEKTKINGSQEPESMVSGETNTEEQSVSVVSVDYEDKRIHTLNNANSIANLKSSRLECASKPNDTSFILKVKTWLKNVRTKFSSTYSKRNSIVNALLSLFLVVSICVSLMVFGMALTIIFKAFNELWSFAAVGIFYPLFSIYFMCGFIIANKKKSIFPAFMGSTFVWFVIIFFYVIVTTPNSAFLDDEGNEAADSWIISFVWPFILSILLNTLLFCFVYLIMKIRKYGASAWTLLDISRGKRSRFEKIVFVVFSVVWMLPVGVNAYHDYKTSHSISEMPSRDNVKIGDYYYTDGTITSDWLVDKTVAGVVFSLETSEADKAQGFSHGQIVAYSDLSDKKQPWDSGNCHDITEYPNYNWDNRLEALKDINGLGYMHCDGYGALPITLSCLHYLENEPTQGLSYWYVPTAGQWTKILENLGHVKVDKMLKFDADSASNYLDWIHIDPQRWYWTITEFDADNAWSIRLKNGEFGSRSNKQNGAYVRPVASF